MSIVAIRGAITIEENTSEEIINNTIELIEEIEKRNNIVKEKVISILFSSTKDLTAEYPAKAARMIGYTNVGLMCFNEMNVKGALDKCVRVMFLYNADYKQSEVKHVYLKGAKILRPDINK